MKINIKNIGNIKNTEVVINGVTLLAGINGSGKSTVSKSLFSIFTSFYDFGNSIKKDKLDTLENIMFHYIGRLEAENISIRKINFEMARKISNELLLESDSIDSIQNVESIVKDKLSETANNGLDVKNIQAVPAKELFDIIKQSPVSVLEQILTTNFRGEFNNQINNIFNHSTGEISLSLKTDKIQVNIENNEVSIAGGPIPLSTDVVYIDDAATNVDDYYSKNIPFFFKHFDSGNHNDHLKSQLGQRNERESHTRKALVSDKLENIFTIITSTLGRVVSNDKSATENRDNQINITNYSSGMKTFYIIKILLEKGIIEENGVLILDEPEVHLHPEWQLKLAEIIILLRKEFGLHILINTHSPYILNALEVYSKKYSIAEECNYYLCSLNDNFSIIKKIKNTEDIYNVLATPLQTLENIEEDIND